MIDFVMNNNKELFSVSSSEHHSLSGGKYKEAAQHQGYWGQVIFQDHRR